MGVEENFRRVSLEYLGSIYAVSSVTMLTLFELTFLMTSRVTVDPRKPVELGKLIIGIPRPARTIGSSGKRLGCFIFGTCLLT